MNECASRAKMVHPIIAKGTCNMSVFLMEIPHRVRHTHNGETAFRRWTRESLKLSLRTCERIERVGKRFLGDRHNTKRYENERMDEDESVTDAERLEAIEEKITELYEKVGGLEGMTGQMNERIKSHENRMNTMQYGKHWSKRDRE